MGRLWRCIATLGLTAVYFAVVTPLAWTARAVRRQWFGPWKRTPRSSYWTALRVESTDPSIYADARIDVAESHRAGGRTSLVRAFRSTASETPVPRTWWVLAAALPWARWAHAPEETELRSDLYVLF